jgi:rhamnosyltransferase
MNVGSLRISVIIPTLNGGPSLASLIHILRTQSLPVADIQIVDSESEDESAMVARAMACEVTVVPRRAFDHGGARNLGAQKASGDILVFLTQDAIPTSPNFLALLTAPIDGRLTAAAYARQIPVAGATPTEAFARLYNYPPESSLRHISRVERRTLKTFFFSNAASAVSRSCFEQVGRFPAPVSTNEDMLLCARLLDAGHQIAYVAEAEVIHSHEFSTREAFRRYFRMGVVVREHRDTFRSVRNSGDGFDFVRRQIAHLRDIGRYDLIPRAVAQAGVKAVAYHCGHALRSWSDSSKPPAPARSDAGD